MAVTIDTYYSSKIIEGSQPSNPSFPVGETPPVLNPPGSGTTDAFVPYEGASRDVDLGANSLLAESITLNPAPVTIPTAQGSLYFDADEETIAAILNGTTQKIGEDSFFQVKNQTGVTIPKGTAVRFDGVVGASGRIKVVPFLADGTYTSMYFVGITNEELLNGGDGKAYNGGKVRGIDTSAFPIGTILYCSTTVAGGFQSTAPIAPNNIISVAAVIAQSATVGALLIRPQIGSNINTDEGVKIVGVQNGDILKYNESTGLFENTPETGSTKDGLISGGLVQWTGTGFVFNVSRALARFSQIELDSLVSSQVTLAASHATLNRRDVFIMQVGFDGAGTPISITPDKITGTPSASPLKPQINPATQIELTDILVIAASTTPTLTTEVIYDENIEWTGSSSGTGTVVFNSAVNPYQGSLSIEATNIENGLKIRLTDASDFDLSTVQTLGFQVDLKSTMFAGQNIGVTFLDSSANPISTELILNLDKTLTVYQFIGIALSQFSFTSFLARSIEFRYIRTKGTVVYSGFYLDIIKLEGGINPPQTVGSFLGLSDVFAPTGYSGQASKVVSVKSDESGLEFVTGGGGGISGLTVNELVYGDTASSIASLPVATYPSLAEFSYMKGVTSAVQTQIDGKQATIAGTATEGYVATAVAGVATWVAPSAGASKWTDVGAGNIYRNSNVSIGHTADPVEAIDLGVAGWVKTGRGYANVGGIYLPYSTASANSRSWVIQSDGNAPGDFVIKRSATQAGDPKTGTVSFLISKDGNASIGGGTPAAFGSYTYLTVVGKSTTNGGSLILQTSDNSYSLQAFVSNAGTNLVTSGASAPMLFSVGGSERMRIHSNGNIEIGGTVDLGFKLHIVGSTFCQGLLQMTDGGSGNIGFGATTGTKIATLTTQKIAFWGKTPIVQPTTGITGAALAGGGGTAITDTHTFGGYTLQQLAAILINTGLTA